MTKTTLDKLLGIDYPIIIAPMFLISNTKMIIAALQNGVSAAFPALNYRTDQELRAAIKEIKSFSTKPFGVNLIVNKSNPKYPGQLETLLELKVDYIITSLGNPKEVIDKCKPLGIKVFCDVVDLAYAKKVESLGADGIIAVNSKAGGHAGDIDPRSLVTLLSPFWRPSPPCRGKSHSELGSNHTDPHPSITHSQQPCLSLYVPLGESGG